jgi:hypothetical protein
MSPAEPERPKTPRQPSPINACRPRDQKTSRTNTRTPSQFHPNPILFILPILLSCQKFPSPRSTSRLVHKLPIRR